MKNFKQAFVRENLTLRQIMKNMNNSALGIALVVDKDSRLLGTVTDGDIRRALLQGNELEDNVLEVMNSTPYTVKLNTPDEDIRDLLIEKKIKKIPVLNDYGQVVNIRILEEFLKKPSKKENQVILMAGGLGSRLRPLTYDIPKPLLKVGEKPILEIIVDQFKSQGFNNFLITVNYKSDQIKNYFQDGKSFGVNIQYVEEKKRLGTAGALSLLTEKPQQPFIVMNGDLLTKINYNSFLEYHINGDYAISVGGREYEFQVPYGVLDIDDEEVISLKEKPKFKFFVNAGIYVITPNLISNIPLNTYYDMTTLIDEVLQDNGKVGCFPIYEYWMDIGQHEDFQKAHADYHEYFSSMVCLK